MASRSDIDPSHRHSWVVFGLIALLAVVSYLPTLRQPFIADDYHNILLSRQLASGSGWAAHLHDPTQIFRTAHLLFTHLLDRAFGPTPLPYYGLSILLHVLNVWLVYFILGAWRESDKRTAAIAAAFFAVYEGHQEAVMWYSASIQSLVCLFILSAFAGWIRWLQDRPSPGAYALVLTGTAAALFTKESAWILLPLLIIPTLANRPAWRRSLPGLLPVGLMVSAVVTWLWLGRLDNNRFLDGSFSLHAPWLSTLCWSLARMLWIWGLAAVAILAVCRPPGWIRRLALAAAWAAVWLMPSCFLTYMGHVPSRHVYGASIGLAWIVGSAFVCLADRLGERRRGWAWVLAVVILFHNVGYLWTKKRTQFLERAASTEALVKLARQARGPVRVERFPYLPVVASSAVEVELGPAAPPVIFELSGEPSRGPLDFRYTALPREGNSAK